MFLRLATATVLLASIFAPRALAQQIDLSAVQIERLGIRVQSAEITQMLSLATIPGQIAAPLDARLAVAVPFGGTVLTVDVLEGSTVENGKSLLSIVSRDYLNARADLAQLEAEYSMARALADRLRKLTAAGIAAETRAEAAEATTVQIEAALNAVRSSLLQTETATGQASTYRLVALSTARVATLAVTPGESVEALETAIVLQASERLWLEAPLSAALAARVRLGDSISLSPGNGKGKVIAVGLNVDPKSRSVILRAEIEEGSSDARPGQNVLATIFTQAPSGTLSVPRQALVRLAGNDVVFAVRSGGFEVVPVNILARGRENAAIMGPIAAGSLVAASGLTELKALAQQDN